MSTLSNDEFEDVKKIRSAVSTITGSLQCLNVVEVAIANNNGTIVVLLRRTPEGWEVNVP